MIHYKYAANFIWSGQIANFVLFVTTAALFFRDENIKNPEDKRFFIGIIIFSLHVACGLVYYARSFTNYY